MQKEQSAFQYARNFAFSVYVFVALGYGAYLNSKGPIGAGNDDFASFTSGGILERSLAWPVLLISDWLDL
ncbi:hypothetical protein BH11ARM2_BH11ARM2_21480 [soil metagenome]